MKRIMVGYDGSEGGRDALALARGLARVEAAESARRDRGSRPDRARLHPPWKLGAGDPGSVCERLLHPAPCAVGIAPRGYAQSEHVGLGIVGMGYDGRDESKHALGFAQEIAAGIGAELRLITVVPDGVVASEWATEAGQLFRHGDPAAVLAQEGVD